MVVVVAGAGVVLDGAVVGFEEEDGKGNFQKPEELAGSALTTSLLFSAGVADDMEALEGERTSQVVRLLGAGFSVSVSGLLFSGWDLSVVGLLSPTVALRMGGGFFFSVCFISVGSSGTSSFSRPIIHQEPEDLVWTRTDSVFLSSMSPIRIRSFINLQIERGWWERQRTTHIPHRSLEFLPVPSITSTVEVAQDFLELVQALSGLVSEEMLANFVPVLLRDLALEAAFLYLVQPCVYWWILLRIAEKTWWVLPGLEDGLEVEFF
jgi:hypothetical protein